MKRGMGAFVFGFLLLSLFLTSVVSADAVTDVAEAMGVGISIALTVIAPIIGLIVGEVTTPESVIAKTFFFIIILSIVYISIKKVSFFTGHKNIRMILSLTVSILATRYIADSTIIEGLLLPYSALGIVLTAALPFIVFFGFVNSSPSKIVRKISWGAFAVAFFAIWTIRADEVGAFVWVYLVTAILALCMIPFDKVMRDIMLKSKIESIEYRQNSKLAAKINDELEEIRERYVRDGRTYTSYYGHAGSGKVAFDADVADAKAQLKGLIP